jgi:hypothetical protein
VLDNSNGVRSVAPPLGSYTPHLTKARDGKLWFVTPDGVAAVDPRHLAINTLPPPVHVEQISAEKEGRTSGGLVRPNIVLSRGEGEGRRTHGMMPNMRRDCW